MSKSLDGIFKLKGKDKEYYELLIAARERAQGRMKYHAEDALDRSNAEKRGVTTHMADVSGDSSRHEMDLRLMSEEGNILDMIELAIKRLLDGEYGQCQDCHEPIAEARLQARPYALFCIKCKTVRENAEKMR